MSSTTITQVLRSHADSFHDRIAYTYAADGLSVSAALSYGQLDRLARRFAERIALCAAPGQRVVLLFPPGLEFIVAFFGCLYAGVIAVPCYVPHKREADWARLRAICADCGPAAIATITKPASFVLSGLASHPTTAHLAILGSALDDIGLEQRALAEPAPDAIAFLQYTSGSTGSPKGVMVSHANLLANLSVIHDHFGHSTNSQGLIWLPAHHDMGLIGGVLAPLYGAFPVRLMSPLAFLQSPVRWLQAVAAVRATTSGGPNFAYALALKRITAAQVAALDLSSWCVAFNGAEPIDPDVVERFCKLLEPARFDPAAIMPCYGLAESTLLVTSLRRSLTPAIHRIDTARLGADRFEISDDGAHSRKYMACGVSAHGHTVEVIDPTTRGACAEGQVGELWVRGPSVAQGYWNKPELTAETFQAETADGVGPFLRTKDRGCFFDGQLVITGRSSDMIIVRGKNHYAEDLEAESRKAHPALSGSVGAAFACDELADSFVLVHEVDRAWTRQLDLPALRELLAGHMCEATGIAPREVRLVTPGSIPRTSSGKVRRRACRDLYLAGQLLELSTETSSS